MITRLNPANEVQTAILSALEADADLIALTSRIYPQQAPNKPQRPFVLYGSPIITPRKVQGGDAADVSGAIHCFADASDTAPDARAFSMDVAALIARILDGMDEVDLGDGMALAIYVNQIQCMQDGDASSWHSFVTYRAEAT